MSSRSRSSGERSGVSASWCWARGKLIAKSIAIAFLEVKTLLLNGMNWLGEGAGFSPERGRSNYQ